MIGSSCNMCAALFAAAINGAWYSVNCLTVFPILGVVFPSRAASSPSHSFISGNLEARVRLQLTLGRGALSLHGAIAPFELRDLVQFVTLYLCFP